MDDFTAGALLREVARLHDRLQRERVACCGTTATQCQIITTLRGGPMTMADLGRALGLDKGWISRAVEAMADEGLLTKTPGDGDRRTIVVALSAEGLARLGELDGALNNLSGGVMQRIPADQRGAVFSALELLRDALLAEAQSAGEPALASRAG